MLFIRLAFDKFDISRLDVWRRSGYTVDTTHTCMGIPGHFVRSDVKNAKREYFIVPGKIVYALELGRYVR